MCDCLNITFQYEGNAPLNFELAPTGTLNGFDTFEFIYFGVTYYIWHDSSTPGDWIISETLGSLPQLTALKNDASDCPLGETPVWLPGLVDYVNTTSCGANCGKEDRMYKRYDAIKLPKTCIEEDRGYNDCCCEQLVLGNAGSDTWKNDKTAVWIKLGSVSDSFNFKLYKNGVLAAYTITPIPFVNEQNAYYAVVNWYDILISDGIGCYEIRRDWDISGITGSDIWGHYNLKPYTIKNALGTARVRALFNLNQEIEGINFTGSNVESSIRFYGFIGNSQPNMEIDNLIYSNREMKSNIRENLPDYEILVDSTLKCITAPLINLYLLSENELFISDYNAHNHDYCIKDLPVIVSESPEMIYPDPFTRKAGIKAKVSDKFKTKRTYY
jgi:hypothetical protein